MAHQDARLIPSTHAETVFSPKQEYYAIRVYQLRTPEQQTLTETYLEKALLPALHRQGISDIGVFTPIGNDTAATRKIYVLIPFKSLEQYLNLPAALEKDSRYAQDGKDYIDAAYDNTPFTRTETILLQAFPGMPQHAKPSLAHDKNSTVYELRSYEAPTEKLLDSKIRMFNKGDEIGIFQRLGFNAVFYATVLSGAHMPNLMYMTSFDNIQAREQHWKAFGDDPAWKQLLAAPEYQHNVSHADIILLHPTLFSDL